MALKRKTPTDQLVDNESLAEDRLSINAGEDLTAFASYHGTANDKQSWDLDAFAPYKPASAEQPVPVVDSALLPDDIDRTRLSLDKTMDFGFAEGNLSSGLSTLHASPIADPEAEEAKKSKSKKAKSEPAPMKPEEMFDVSYATDWSQYADPIPAPLETIVEEEPAVAAAVPLFAEPAAEGVDPSQLGEPGRFFVRLGKFSATYDLDVPEMIVGRPDPDSEILPEITVEWDDAISRRHARVFRKGSEDYIEDLGSTNGTKVNGIALYAHNPQLLINGDLIHVGSRTEIGYYK